MPPTFVERSSPAADHRSTVNGGEYCNSSPSTSSCANDEDKCGEAVLSSSLKKQQHHLQSSSGNNSTSINNGNSMVADGTAVQFAGIGRRVGASTTSNHLSSPPNLVKETKTRTASESSASATFIRRKRAGTAESAGAANAGHTQSGGGDEDDGNGWVVELQRNLFENYHAVAYSLIIVTYFLAFGEYLYLRLISLIFPERITYRTQCGKHENETIVRNEIHYISATLIFVVLAIFQLVCFFLLTVSERWLDVRRSFAHFISMEERLRHELAFSIKRVMFETVFPAFLVYGMCSAAVGCAIFYMIGMRDPVQHVGSQVIIYLFDACVLLYFTAFPLISLIFHPDIECCSHRIQRRKLQVSPSAGGGARFHTVATTSTSSSSVAAAGDKRRRHGNVNGNGGRQRGARGRNTVTSNVSTTMAATVDEAEETTAPQASQPTESEDSDLRKSACGTPPGKQLQVVNVKKTQQPFSESFQHGGGCGPYGTRPSKDDVVLGAQREYRRGAPAGSSSGGGRTRAAAAVASVAPSTSAAGLVAVTLPGYHAAATTIQNRLRADRYRRLNNSGVLATTDYPPDNSSSGSVGSREERVICSR